MGDQTSNISNALPFYHIRARQYEVGDVLRGSGQRPLQVRESHIEDILEHHRPQASPDRGESVYLRREREFGTVGVTFDEGYIHTVEPIGRAEKRDLKWIGFLQRRHHRDARLRKDMCPGIADEEIAASYWNGSASDQPDWEWVAQEAVVVEVDEEVSRVTPRFGFLSILGNER